MPKETVRYLPGAIRRAPDESKGRISRTLEAAHPAYELVGRGRRRGIRWAEPEAPGHNRVELLERARQLGISNRTRMTMQQLEDAIARLGG